MNADSLVTAAIATTVFDASLLDTWSSREPPHVSHFHAHHVCRPVDRQPDTRRNTLSGEGPWDSRSPSETRLTLINRESYSCVISSSLA